MWSIPGFTKYTVEELGASVDSHEKNIKWFTINLRLEFKSRSSKRGKSFLKPGSWEYLLIQNTQSSTSEIQIPELI